MAEAQKTAWRIIGRRSGWTSLARGDEPREALEEWAATTAWGSLDELEGALGELRCTVDWHKHVIFLED